MNKIHERSFCNLTFVFLFFFYRARVAMWQWHLNVYTLLNMWYTDSAIVILVPFNSFCNFNHKLRLSPANGVLRVYNVCHFNHITSCGMPIVLSPTAVVHHIGTLHMFINQQLHKSSLTQKHHREVAMSVINFRMITGINTVYASLARWCSFPPAPFQPGGAVISSPLPAWQAVVSEPHLEAMRTYAPQYLSVGKIILVHYAIIFSNFIDIMVTAK